MPICPRCFSRNLFRFGKRDGRQRWRCDICKLTTMYPRLRRPKHCESLVKPMIELTSTKTKKVLEYATAILREEGHSNWKVELSDASPSECISELKTIQLCNKRLLLSLWEIRLEVIHEIAHIATWPEDMLHGKIYFKEYVRLVSKYLT